MTIRMLQLKLNCKHSRPAEVSGFQFVDFPTRGDNILDLVLADDNQGPDLQRILCQTYDSAALMPDLRRACELRAISKKS